MAKFQETFDHTADIGINAAADSLNELFEALAEGLSDVIFVRSQVNAVESSRIVVHAEDVEAMAVDFLAKVLNLIQVDHFLPAKINVIEIDETHLRAELAGEHYDSKKHELKTEVKAVTYHQLLIARRVKKWVGRVIFDL